VRSEQSLKQTLAKKVSPDEILLIRIKEIEGEFKQCTINLGMISRTRWFEDGARRAYQRQLHLLQSFPLVLAVSFLMFMKS
jgi:hypothetical protein